MKTTCRLLVLWNFNKLPGYDLQDQSETDGNYAVTTTNNCFVINWHKYLL